MTTTPDITPALVEALRDAARRNEAFDRLTAAMLRPLYWHIRRLVVVHEDAQDACQECFVKAYDGLEAFRGGADELRAWLYRIATRAALTLLRRRRRSLFASLDEVGRELAVRVADEAGPDACMRRCSNCRSSSAWSSTCATSTTCPTPPSPASSESGSRR